MKRIKKRTAGVLLALVLILVAGITAFAGPETPIVKPKPNIKEVSLVLDGEIGLVFHFYTPGSYENGYVELYKLDGNNEKYAVIKKNITDCESSGGARNYAVTYPLSAVELSEKIHIAIFSADHTLLAQNVFSAERYIRTIVPESYTGASEKEKEVARTLLNYGHYAQLACSEANGWEIGVEYPETEAYDALKADTRVFDAYDIEWSTCTGEFNDLYMSLGLDYKTGIHLYIPVKDKPTVTVENLSETEKNKTPIITEYPPEKTDRVKDTVTYEIYIEGINALNLGDEYRITVNDVSVTLSAFSYCKLTSQNTNSQNTLDAIIALYEFYEATEAYLDTNEEV